MARRPIRFPNGRILRPGDWLQLEDGVGKFSGAWENPTLGLIYCLKHFRRFDAPARAVTLWCTLDCRTALETLERAVTVAGPMRRDGTPPRSLEGPPALRLIEGRA